ncbi:MAG TPA: response regulator transcription factor [Parafilimonas sp.]|nr:response regulator transcription factor [Parafilimonas sp.]
MKIPIAIVDDRSQNRLSLAERINVSDDISVNFTASNGADFLDQMKRTSPLQLPQVVLMDIEMPVMDGIEAVRLGKQLYPDVKFLMLTVFDDDDKIFEAIKAGASGYLLKDEKVSTIIEYVHQLSEMDAAPMSPSIARKALNMLVRRPEIQQPMNEELPSMQSNLSQRETEILRLLVDGYDYRSTAEKLFLSTHTVRKHIANIYEKLHVNSKAKAISVATKNKLL